MAVLTDLPMPNDLNEAEAYLNLMSAIAEIDQDRLETAINQYRPFATRDTEELLEKAENMVRRLDALQELTEETERLGLYEVSP